ncbi:glycosyl hydrolase family 26 [Streptomyces sp. 846.5]|nr:glycosyl hydrolase [Streptomyces sp. 846.5]TDU06135.1 glycosyl hydrolase family 26 [Streptomyces sp. 846.5]
MAVNAVLLSALSYGVYAAVVSNAQGPGFTGLGASSGSAPNLIERLKGASTTVVPDRSQFLKPTDGDYFGASTLKAPYDAKELADFTTSDGGIHPTMASFFLQWNQKFNPYAITAAYDNGTIPVMTWEPWAGGTQNPAGGGVILQSNVKQPAYKLSNIYDGKFDAYITSVAQQIAAAQWPIVIRFAHEMNGAWYPWSEKVNGNAAGDYVKAWRHVHDVFAKAGATNVIWVWSPNIIRPVPNTALAPLYPGDAYVDWIGMTGYGVQENTPAITFNPTLAQLRKISKKPIMIMETGAQPDKHQASWVSAFFPWLKANPDVIGFIWMEKTRGTGARADWRFTTDPKIQALFQSGLATLRLTTGQPASATSASPSPSSASTP